MFSFDVSREMSLLVKAKAGGLTLEQALDDIETARDRNGIPLSVSERKSYSEMWPRIMNRPELPKEKT